MSDEKLNLSRRSALRLIATTAASVPVIGCAEKVAEKTVEKAAKSAPVEAPRNPVPVRKAPLRSPTDPDLLNPTIHWDFVLEEGELVTLAALCDVIIPADEISPSASEVGAHHYINEYVSAPYDNNKADLITVRGGVVWLDSESKRRFQRPFTELDGTQKTAICDDIKWEKTARAEFKAGARFFAKVRNLAATAFYTTEAGMADIGYVGNKPTAVFAGPPPEVLARLGLDG
ncbi:gluconate 2-dehydrogenase subunit 3 family protein [Microbulbifer taiwanensis]|uniref:Gluconate 2-dehydrogenase subunit 3 family protein n=1 Tax=Microbulbifer taiwanensis TaxID=986746 RepID=A0ABW1YUC5_9GAMM|nr:gluconate 2-dehydrogenase subunit 3 family protein [Microbulbifer taiwanensis]